MNTLILFDAGPPLEAVGGLLAAVVFFVICIVGGIVAFFLLKKTLKMAMRIIIVAGILLIAVIGGISFIWLGIAKSSRPHPGPQHPAPTRTP